jgi:pyrroline-5-carboxylate reductase
MNNWSNRRLGFVGAGNMAEAMVRGVLRSGLVAPERIIASDPSEERRQKLHALKVHTVEDNREIPPEADVIILAVKPQMIDNVLTELAPLTTPEHLFVSIAAGVTIQRLKAGLPAATHVIRAMPNTPMLVGEGAVGFCGCADTTATDLDLAAALFAAAAPVVVPVSSEKLLDAVTAVSGSGPAYVFYLVEQMVKGGVAEGLDEADAMRLAMQTCTGAAALLDQSGETPETLRRKVTSPNGTTQAAIEHLEQAGAGEALLEAVRRAAARARELGT